MKNAFFATAALFFLFAFQTTVNAQRNVTWKGGTPGRANDWNCASNWKEGRVPDAFSDVIIPNLSNTAQQHPVIRGEVDGVNSLTLLTGAKLCIEKKGSLEVFEMMVAYGQSKLLNQGVLSAPLGEGSAMKNEALLAGLQPR